MNQRPKNQYQFNRKMRKVRYRNRRINSPRRPLEAGTPQNVPLFLLRLLELVASLAAIAAISAWWFVERPAIQDHRMALNEERIARSWESLDMASAGASGKSAAITFMAKNDINLSGLNLSVLKHGEPGVTLRAAMGVNINFDDSNFSGIRIFDSNLHNTSFLRADISDAKIGETNLAGSIFYLTHLVNTDFWNVNLKDASFSSTNFTDGSIYLSELTNTSFQGSILTGTQFGACNISNANFQDTSGLKSDAFKTCFAWADRMPILPDHVNAPVSMDPNLRIEWENGLLGISDKLSTVLLVSKTEHDKIPQPFPFQRQD